MWTGKGRKRLLKTNSARNSFTEEGRPGKGREYERGETAKKEKRSSEEAKRKAPERYLRGERR